MPALSDTRVDAVLAKLGVPRPGRDLAGLRSVYGGWCRRVPFDNVRKRIHLHEGRPGPLPGDDPDEFFEAWLAHGAGGTCWAGNGALHALLRALGFDAQRGIGTMLVVPDLPPNHGTVAVDLDEGRFLVDASILHGEPLPLFRDRESCVTHAAWGVRCRPDGEGWRVRWRPLHLEAGMDCRIDRLGASDAEFRAMHEATRGWSPFNFQLSARLVRGDAVVGVGLGHVGTIDATGRMHVSRLTDAARRRHLVEVLGMSEAIANALPPDEPTPPPPGSRTAART